MKVLLISIYHPELVRGGAQQVCWELFEGLKRRPGVEPLLLAAVDPAFDALYKSGAGITGFDGRADEFLFLSRGYDFWWHKLTNPTLVEKFEEFLERAAPDVIHFHHFLLLGVDLLTLARRALPRARIVLTLHDFIAICAADGQMARRTDGSPCARASQVRCHQCVPERAPEQFFLRERWMKRHLEACDAFVTPSAFMVERFVAWGLERRRIVEVPNGLELAGAARRPEPAPGKRNRFGFFGQLLDAKGVALLLDAADLLRGSGFTDFVIEINGDNLGRASPPARERFAAAIEAEQARPPAARTVVFNGPYDHGGLAARMARIDWCVAPSLWPEAFALVVSEAWAFGKPVIASALGALGERVRHEVDGLLFPAGDVRALAATIQRACEDEELWRRLAAGVRPPPTREAMVDACLEVYAGRAEAGGGAILRS